MRFQIYHNRFGPQPSEDQPDPNNLSRKGEVDIIHKHGLVKFGVYWETDSKRVWAVPVEEASVG